MRKRWVPSVLPGSRLGVELSFGQAMVTSGNIAAIDQLSSLVFDTEDVDLKKPAKRDHIWISPSLIPDAYKAVANKNGFVPEIETKKSASDVVLDLKSRHGPRPKVLILSLKDLGRDSGSLSECYGSPFSHRILALFDTTVRCLETHTLMSLLSLNQTPGSRALLTDSHSVSIARTTSAPWSRLQHFSR